MMEDQETILHALQEFDAMSEKIVSPELEQLLCFIAKTGKITYPWNLLKPLFKVKLDKVMREFFEASPTRNGNSTQPTQVTEFEVMRQRLLDCLESFDSAPFTVQRLCELMVEPRKHYRNSEKFMRGVEKNVLVVSTVEPSTNLDSDNQANNNESHVVPSLAQSVLGMPNGILSEEEHIHVNSNGDHHQHPHIDILGRPSPLNSFLDNDTTIHTSQVTQEEITETIETRTNVTPLIENNSVLEESPLEVIQSTENVESEVRIHTEESVCTEEELDTRNNSQSVRGNNMGNSSSMDEVQPHGEQASENDGSANENESSIEETKEDTTQQCNQDEEVPSETQPEEQHDDISSSETKKEGMQTDIDEPMDQD